MKSEWYILFVKKNAELKIIDSIRKTLEQKKFFYLKEKIVDIKFLSYIDDFGNLKNKIPGYIFLNCFISEELINFLYSTEGLIGFPNHNRKNKEYPSYLSNLEVNNLFSLLEKTSKKEGLGQKDTKPKKNLKINFENTEKKVKENRKNNQFEIGEIVLIKSGLFKDNQGSIIQVNKDFLTINIEFFGRITPVSISSFHCEKI